MKFLLSLGLVGLTALILGSAPVAEAAVSKSQRRLVIVSSLQKFGQAKYVWLYNFLDASTISLGQTSLTNNYQAISVLPETSGKKSTFVYLLKTLTANSSVKAVDVILSLHGAENKLWFYDGSVSTNDLKNDLLANPNRSKLRLMYNLACYGSSHRNEFIASGFRSAIGSRKTNTASASEYPAFLSRWKLGHTIDSIFALTNADPALGASDAAAGTMGFNDADSRKLISGFKPLNINANAQ